jgi:RNA polymerase sigma factor (sigma-70 family)
MAPLLSSALLRAQTDDRLLALAAAGHDRAFEAIVERYRRPLQRYLRRLLSETLAEDVIQATFFSAWSSLRAGTEVRDLRPWLYRIAHNAAINALKKVGEAMEELPESVGGLATEPEAEIERRDEMRHALTIIAALPARQRTALLAVAVEGRAHSDVAAELGLTDGAVRQLVHRARNTLRTTATAATPVPLLQWMLASTGDSTIQRVAEVAAGAGGAGPAAMSLKAGAAAVLATGALVTGGSEVAKVVTPEKAVQPSPALSATPLSPASGPAGGANFTTTTIAAPTRAGPAPSAGSPTATTSESPRGDRRRRRGRSGEAERAGSSKRRPGGATSTDHGRAPVVADADDHGSRNRGPGSPGSGDGASSASGELPRSGGSGNRDPGGGSSGKGGGGSGGSGKAPAPAGAPSGKGPGGGGTSGSGKGVSGGGSEGPPVTPSTEGPAPTAEPVSAAEPAPTDTSAMGDAGPMGGGVGGMRDAGVADATAGAPAQSVATGPPVETAPTPAPVTAAATPPAPAANGGAVRTAAGDDSGPG